MKNTLKKATVLIMIAWIMIGGSLAVSLAMVPGRAAAASGADTVETCRHGFFGLKPWYQYIGKELDDGKAPSGASDEEKVEAKRNLCNVKCFNVFTVSEANDCGQKSSDIPLVLLAVADDLLRIAGLIALGFIFVGAFKYVGSQGNPDSTKSAQETIINALLGLAISLTAVAIVSFIGNKLGS
jgi:hypothetical protein